MRNFTNDQRAKATETRAANAEARKPKNREDCVERLALLRSEVPTYYRNLVEQVADGSKAAAVKLNCLQCVGFERAEVTKCTSVQCPMWAFRPYQGKADADGYSTDDEDRRAEEKTTSSITEPSRSRR